MRQERSRDGETRREENQIMVDLSLMSVIHDERRKDNASLHTRWQYPTNLWHKVQLCDKNTRYNARLIRSHFGRVIFRSLDGILIYQLED